MTDITKLSAGLRREAPAGCGELVAIGSQSLKVCAAIHRCADAIDAWAAENMPEWTKITEDKSTWPEDGRYILANPSGKKLRRYKFFRTHMSAYFGVWYRYLTEYDYPPVESK